jgi:mRNA interferase MazF
MIIKRGDVYYADLSPIVGSEQGGIRPVLVLQNDVGNKYSPTVIVSAITSQINKTKLPTHIPLETSSGLSKDSVVLLEQIRTIDKQRLKEKICHIDGLTMQQVNDALSIVSVCHKAKCGTRSVPFFLLKDHAICCNIRYMCDERFSETQMQIFSLPQGRRCRPIQLPFLLLPALYAGRALRRPVHIYKRRRQGLFRMRGSACERQLRLHHRPPEVGCG